MTTDYKTTEYQRRAYSAYLERNKNNEEFQEKRRESARKYYLANKEKVLARMKKIREEKKNANPSG